MPQTLLALAGLMAAMLFSVNYQQSVIQSHRVAVNAEMEVIASALASETMHHIGTKPFDFATAALIVTPSNLDLSSLTHGDAFGSGRAFDDCEEIDDFNEMQRLTKTYTVNDTLSLAFSIDATVTYIDADGNSTSAQTWVKEVTLTVNGPQAPNGMDYLIKPVTLKRQFSPQWD